MAKLGFVLLPDKEQLRKYNTLIADLAKEYGTLEFEAHVTLLNDLEGDQKLIIDGVAEVAEGLRKMPLEFWGTTFSNRHYQCVFAQVKMTEQLLIAHNSIRSALEFPVEYSYFPHMSIIYGDLSEKQRAELAERVVVDYGFIADVLAIVNTEDDDPRTWDHVAEFKLK